MNSYQIKDYIYSNRIIGKGAFSKVYKGLDTKNDEIIAIKVIDKFQIKKNVIDRLKEEIKLLNDIEHENIINLKDFTEDEYHYYLIMEYCNGGDLHQKIRKGKISEDIAKNYMKQIMFALRYLKSLNIIHRDLKPQNILLTNDDKTIKITDFNFAREMFDNDISQTFCGSPLYMAPEIIKRNEYNVKSDLWSIGLILYEMVYGINPYIDCINIIDLLEKINKRSIKYNSSVSDDCNSLIQKLLIINPNERISWDDFFINNWINIDEPLYLSNEDIMWDSINLSEINNKNYPKSNRFQIDVVDNYTPLGCSPPKFSKSTPMDIYRISNKKEQSQYNYSSSAPDNKMKNHLWTYMSNSVNIIKGAVDYISSTTGSLK